MKEYLWYWRVYSGTTQYFLWEFLVEPEKKQKNILPKSDIALEDWPDGQEFFTLSAEIVKHMG